MRLIKVRDFCRQLGIPRRTVNWWIEQDRSIAQWVPYKGKRKRGIYKGEYWIRLDRIAQKAGFSDVEALLLPGARWIKAIDLAQRYHIPRETVAYWCRTKPGFAKRIGRIWYIDIDQLGATTEQLETLSLSNLSKVETPEVRST